MSEYVEIVLEAPPAIVEVVGDLGKPVIEVINQGKADHVEIVVNEPPAIVEIVTGEGKPIIEVINEQVIEIVYFAAMIMGEEPAGAVDGVNKTFTTEFNFLSGKIGVYVNGLRQRKSDYHETGTNQISIDDAPQTGDAVQVDYIKT